MTAFIREAPLPAANGNGAPINIASNNTIFFPRGARFQAVADATVTVETSIDGVEWQTAGSFPAPGGIGGTLNPAKFLRGVVSAYASGQPRLLVAGFEAVSTQGPPIEDLVLDTPAFVGAGEPRDFALYGAAGYAVRQLSGQGLPFTATVELQESIDGVNFQTIPGTSSGSSSSALFFVSPLVIPFIRANTTAYVSGTPQALVMGSRAAYFTK